VDRSGSSGCGVYIGHLPAWLGVILFTVHRPMCNKFAGSSNVVAVIIAIKSRRSTSLSRSAFKIKCNVAKHGIGVYKLPDCAVLVVGDVGGNIPTMSCAVQS